MQLKEFVPYSNVMVSDDSTEKQVEEAKKFIRDHLEAELTVDEHMHLLVDMIAVLHERDLEKYKAVIMACVVHDIEEQMGDIMTGQINIFVKGGEKK